MNLAATHVIAGIVAIVLALLLVVAVPMIFFAFRRSVPYSRTAQIRGVHPYVLVVTLCVCLEAASAFVLLIGVNTLALPLNDATTVILRSVAGLLLVIVVASFLATAIMAILFLRRARNVARKRSS